jgi:hypothetical protein
MVQMASRPIGSPCSSSSVEVQQKSFGVRQSLLPLVHLSVEALPEFYELY